MKLTTVKALAALVDAHDDQQLTSEPWDNAREVLTPQTKADPKIGSHRFEINVRRFGLMDKGIPSACFITIYPGANEMKNNIIVIATQSEDKPGVSVTNAAEQYAQAVGQYFSIPLNALVWIEHYPARHTIKESFDRVVFDNSAMKLIKPRWNRLDRETVEHWIGGKL